MKISTEAPLLPIKLNLTLNLKEAMILRLICGSVVGSFNGPRGMTNEIEAFLGKLGIPYPEHDLGENITLPDLWESVVPDPD